VRIWLEKSTAAFSNAYRYTSNSGDALFFSADVGPPDEGKVTSGIVKVNYTTAKSLASLA